MKPEAWGPYILRFLTLFALTLIGTLHWGQNGDAFGIPGLLLWPPAGIALALAYLWGYEIIPAAALASLAGHLTSGEPILLSISVALALSAETAIGVWLMRYMRIDESFSHIRDALGLAAAAAAASTMAAAISVSALIAATAFRYGHFPQLFGMWWVGDFFVMMVIAPFVILWMGNLSFSRSPARIAEGILMFGLLAAACAIAFLTINVPFGVRFPMLFLFVPFMWIVLRSDPRAVTLAILTSATFIVGGTLLGLGSFAQNVLPDRLVLSQLFGTMVAIVFLTFSSALEERKNTNASLVAHADELEAALKTIRTADRAKSDFIAILAHELRNPLSPLLNTLDLFEIKRPPAPEILQNVSMMRGNVLTMKRLLDDLLDISRLSRKGYALKREPIDVTAIAERAIVNTRHLMAERAQTLSVSIAADPLMTNADSVRLEQIIVNLLSNAARYTPETGAISFTCRSRDCGIEIIVSDTGVGIHRDALPRIFEPFWQAHDAQSKGGLGIGLAIVKKLVELHDGRIEVESTPGKGSTFTICLPALDQARLPLSRKPARSDASTLSILVVDDNVAAAESLQKLLRAMGHASTVAFEGNGAAQLVASLHPQVVILDIGLPDISGYDVARRIRAGATPAVLVALTGYGQDEDKAKAKAAGFDFHLTKPASFAEIQAVLASAALLLTKPDSNSSVRATFAM